MTSRIFGAAFAAVLLIVLAAPAHADIVVLRDGNFLPKKRVEGFTAGDVPSHLQLKDSGKNNSELTFSTVKVGKQTVSAALVVEIFTTMAAQNSDFNDGETFAASGDFGSAAHKFGLAAQDLDGSDKQLALYKRMLSLQALGGDLNPIMKAADELIAANPNGFYVPAAHMLRARIFASQGQNKKAKGALDAITTATGMNARDFFEAELTKIDWFHLRGAGNDATKLGAVLKKYANIEMQAKGKGADAKIQALKAVVGAARCQVRMGKWGEARKAFERVTNDSEIDDKTLLGSAYHGLGDAVYGQAKADLASAAGDQGKIDSAKAALTEAALHYLRVTEFYGMDFAADNVLDCTTNLARVFANQFSLGDNKDCSLGSRAYQYYVRAAKAMSRGETKTQLIREALAFKKDLDAACKKK